MRPALAEIPSGSSYSETLIRSTGSNNQIVCYLTPSLDLAPSISSQRCHYLLRVGYRTNQATIRKGDGEICAKQQRTVGIPALDALEGAEELEEGIFDLGERKLLAQAYARASGERDVLPSVQRGRSCVSHKKFRRRRVTEGKAKAHTRSEGSHPTSLGGTHRHLLQRHPYVYAYCITTT